MNVLVISTILPIPGLSSYNDFVFQTYINYRKLFPTDEVLIIKPVKYYPGSLIGLKGTSQPRKQKSQHSWRIHGFQVEMFYFISSWRLRNLHSVLTRSIFYLNKKKIRELFLLHRFGIMHAHYIFPDGMLAYLLYRTYGIPYVITTHNERFYFDHYLSRNAAIKILQNATQVIPINYTNATFYKALGLTNIDIAPLGFDKVFVKEQRIVTNDEVRIVTASALIKLKNIDRVIYAIKKLVRQYNVTYTIIGNGPEKSNLARLVHSLQLDNRVFFVEHIPHEQIAGELYKYDIFIMPSCFETFGRIYFECMAMGIPVICAKHSGIFGLFKDKEEGIAVDHNSIDEITKALEYLISNPQERGRIGRNGQRLVRKYTWEYVAEDLRARYKQSISSEI